MRKLRMFALTVVIVMIAAACTEAGGDGDGGDGGAPQEENTGSVNVLAAVEPEEADAINAIFDEHINADAEFTAEIEASGNFEEQVQIRAAGGTLDVILLPQPGGVVDHAESGNAVSLEDLGFDIGQLEDTFGEYFLSLGESGGEHYGIPTNINL
ncbi:MAG: hypothetical protein M3138_02085, partial [Actinomycetota bacterium]|nr:hypothetical protein [Actinomycetota bacterium]